MLSSARSMLSEDTLQAQPNLWKFNYQGLMVTDTAPFRNPNYHRTTDTPDTIDYIRLAHTTSALRQVVVDLASSD